MKVIVDTCIWSLALRRKNNALSEKQLKILEIFKELINDSRVVLIGNIRQEIFSGVKSTKQFNKLKNVLSSFDDINLNKNDYEKAAECFNICRKSGIQGSHIDFLICATSLNYKLPIFTNDLDFNKYQKHLNFNLLKT